MPSTRVISLSPSKANVPAGMSLEQWRSTLTVAASSWNVPCASVRLEVSEPVQWWRAVEDGRNLVVFRRETWCHNEQCGRKGAFPLHAMGMTTTYPEGARGAMVLEADVELNAKTFNFTFGETTGARAAGTTWTVPLHPVLVHELGHVLGLRDACVNSHGQWNAKSGACPESEQKRAMFAPALLEEPAPADVAELCALHPAVASASEGVAAPGPEALNGSAIYVASLAVLVVVGASIFLRRRNA